MEAMTAIVTQQIAQAWGTLQSYVPVAPIRNERQYERAVEKLNELLDLVGDNETHPLYDLLDTLGILIHNYEESHYSAPTVTGNDVLQFLIEEHRLTPASFPELGSEETVQNLLAGKQALNVENIRALSRRFGLSPETFFA